MVEQRLLLRILVLESELFKKRCLLEFEGERFWATENYDTYLQRLYGDYMKLPPEKERIGLHALNVDFGDY